MCWGNGKSESTLDKPDVCHLGGIVDSSLARTFCNIPPFQVGDCIEGAVDCKRLELSQMSSVRHCISPTNPRIIPYSSRQILKFATIKQHWANIYECFSQYPFQLSPVCWGNSKSGSGSYVYHLGSIVDPLLARSFRSILSIKVGIAWKILRIVKGTTVFPNVWPVILRKSVPQLCSISGHMLLAMQP